jgi:MFS family permease
MGVSTEIAAEPAFDGRAAVGAAAPPEPTLYGRAFWSTYVANAAFTIAMAMMYRYADFVLYLGGNEWTVGRIVGVGMVGSLAMRFFQGFGIDHFGARRIWLWSVAVFALAIAAHVLVTSPDGPAIYALRILYTTSMAGVFGASITSVSRSLPLARMAEVIGSLGTSGFIGMALGPLVGDYFCGGASITRGDLNWLFGVAAALGVVSLLCAEFATRAEPRPRRRRRPPLVWLLRRYHPGFLMSLAVVMGVGFVLPTTFLPTFAKELGIARTGPFFIVYAATAFVARLSTRTMPRRFGVRPMIFIGLAALVASMLAYLIVTSEWALMVPGVFAGIAHAVLFPAVTAQGSAAFPSRYRGLGTTVMLAMLDLGTLTGAPLVGGLVETSKSVNLPPYPTTFLVLSVGVIITAVAYAFTERR